nr:MAG: VP3 protein [Solemoviridae sp. 2]
MNQQAIHQLISALSNMTTKPKPKRNRKVKKTVANNPNGLVAETSKPRKRRARNGTGGDGAITVKRTELLCTVDSNATKVIDIFPSDEVLPWLNKLIPAFERIVWVSARLEYRPYVGANTSGVVMFGPDWNSSHSASGKPSKKDVQSTTPCVEGPVWNPCVLSLPPQRLMTRKEYSLQSSDKNDKQPCQILLFSNGNTEVGDVWLSYHVRLVGTRN